MVKIFILALAALSIALAWLVPTDTSFWSSFLGEFLAFCGVIFLVAAHFGKNIKLPLFALPTLLIALIPILQYWLNIIVFSSTMFLSASYVIGFWLVVVLTHSMSQQLEVRKQLMQGFCYTVMISGLISAIFAITQWLNIYTPLPIMMPLQGSRPYANFGQPNHLATLLVMSVLGGIYLFEKKKLPTIFFVTISLINIFAIALSQSRTSWIALAFVLSVWLYKNRIYNNRFNVRWVLGSISAYIVFVFSLPLFNSFIFQYFNLTNIIQTTDVIQRATTQYERIELWSTAMDLISLRPWWGYGWNQTGLAHLQMIESFPYWFTSAHNIILDLLIWNGVFFGIVIVIYITIWLWKIFKAANSLESIISIMMISAVLIHALLEYPLYYSYFLLPVGFLIGIANSCLPQKQLSIPSYYLPLILGVIILSLTAMWHQYLNSFTLMANAKSIESYRLEQKEPVYDYQTTLPYIGSFPLLSIVESRAEWIVLNPFTHISEDEIKLYEQVVSFSPSQYDLYKYAQLLAYNGQIEKAELYLNILKVIHKKRYMVEDLKKQPLNDEGI